jgi:hypothetical protein
MTEPILEFKVVEGGNSSKSPDAIVTLPILTLAAELLMDCAATGGVGVISGPSGSGKSIALRRLVTRYPAMGQPGNAVYYCCQNGVGPTRGVIALLGDIGVGGAIITNGHGAPMPLVLKIALREFVRKNIRCVLLDESDRWNSDTIAGLFAMHDYLRENGHPFALLMVTNQDSPTWLGDADPIRSRTLRVIRVGHVAVEEMIGIMAVWGEEFSKFSAKVDEGDKAADEVARHIHDSTGGDLRRVNFFARVFLRHFWGKAVTMKNAEATLERLEQ